MTTPWILTILFTITVAAIAAAILCRIKGEWFAGCSGTRFSRGVRTMRARLRNIFVPSKKSGTGWAALALVAVIGLGGCFSLTPQPGGAVSSAVSSSTAPSSRAPSSIAAESAVSSAASAKFQPPMQTGGFRMFSELTTGSIRSVWAGEMDVLRVLTGDGAVYARGHMQQELLKGGDGSRVALPEPIRMMAGDLFVGESGTLYLWYDQIRIDPFELQRSGRIDSRWITIPFDQQVAQIVPFGTLDFLLITPDGAAYTVGERALYGKCESAKPLPTQTELFRPVQVVLPEPITAGAYTDLWLYVLGQSGTVYQAPCYGYVFVAGEGHYPFEPGKRPTEQESVFRAVDGAANVQAIAAGNENDALWTLNADGTVTAYRVNEPIGSSGYRKTVLEMTAMAVSVPEPIAELIPFVGQPLLRTAAGECYQCRPDDPLQTEKCAWNGVFQARSCGREVLFCDADGVLCSYFSDNPDGFSRDALCVVGWPGIVLAD